jgi:hypothetical protein
MRMGRKRHQPGVGGGAEIPTEELEETPKMNKSSVMLGEEY